MDMGIFSGQRKLRGRLSGRRQWDSVRSQNRAELWRWLGGRREWHSIRGQDNPDLWRWLGGRRKRHSVRSLHDAEFRRRLGGRRQWHAICDVAIPPANSACKPVVDRKSDGKYD